MNEFDWIPGKTVPLSVIGKSGGEQAINHIVWNCYAIAMRIPRGYDRSPIDLMRTIAEAVLMGPASEYQYRIRLQAKQRAASWGDWCGGEVDLKADVELLLRLASSNV